MLQDYFNINEPVLFGYPIVYNVSMAIPFIGVPALGILISYVATSLGLMSPSVVQVPWTTPILLAHSYQLVVTGEQ